MNVRGTPRVVVGGIKKECCAARVWKNSLERCCGSSSQNVSYLITCEVTLLLVLFFLPLLPVEIMFCLHQNLNSARSISALVTTLPLPLFRLSMLRVCAGAAPLLFVLGDDFCSLGEHLRVLPLTVRLHSRHQRAHVLRGGIAAIPSLPLSASLKFLVLADTP